MVFKALLPNSCSFGPLNVCVVIFIGSLLEFAVMRESFTYPFTF